MASQGSCRNLPKVHGFWRHPHKTLKDSLLSLLIASILPTSPCPDGKDPVEHATTMREALFKMTKSGLSAKNGGFKRMASDYGCDLAEVTIEVERNDKLFKNWGVTSRWKTPEYVLKEDKVIKVHLTFPVSLLPDNIKLPTERNAFGCLSLERKDILKVLSKDTPVVVYFHGGALTIGNPRSMDGVDLMADTLKASPKPIIYACVEYSQAPDHPFPLAPLEACSVVSHFLDLDYKIHIAGLSAGGHLALVCGLEAFRAHTARFNILSIVAGCPMVNPAADSESYYENGAARFCTVPFLRWSYQVYLGLEASTAERMEDMDSTSADALLAQNSNRKAWTQSKWYSSSLRRLAEPSVNLPFGLSDGPKLIISTNKADPLRDDGVKMVEALKAVGAGKLLTHLDHPGSHWIGTQINKSLYKQFTDEWKKAIFAA